MTKNSKLSAVALAIALSLLAAQPSSGLALPSKVFKNCTELRKTYPGGVAKSASSTNSGGATKKTPSVNSKAVSYTHLTLPTKRIV